MPGFGPGARVAGYRIEERIGAGGMAVVFRAVDERLGRRVALKVLAPALAADDAFRKRFIRESRAAAAVDDPHIIPVYEAGEADGVLFIAMRFVPGRDVGQLIRDAGPLPPARAVPIISAVASALDSAHAAGLVHRDVKPANMLVDVRPGRADHVYLSDFGLSKPALTSFDLTGSGIFLGTLSYSSPEQIEGRAIDGRADQYSLACAAFEMLEGSPPFVRAQSAAVIWAHMSDRPPALSALAPGGNPAADAVLARALAKRPEDRFPDCCELAAELQAALAHRRPDAVAPVSRPPSATPRASAAAGDPGASADTLASAAAGTPDPRASADTLASAAARAPDPGASADTVARAAARAPHPAAHADPGVQEQPRPNDAAAGPAPAGGWSGPGQSAPTGPIRRPGRTSAQSPARTFPLRPANAESGSAPTASPRPWRWRPGLAAGLAVAVVALVAVLVMGWLG